MGALRKTLVYLGLAEDEYDDIDAAGDDGAGVRTAEDSPARASERPTLDQAAHQRQGGERIVERAGGRGMDRFSESPQGGRRATVTALPHVVGAQGPMQRITAVHPRSYNDAKIIGEHFRDGVPVIMNLTEMGDADAKRLVDFAAGLVFGLQGVVERVTTKVFLLSPATIEVMNEVQDPAPSTTFFNQS